MFIDLTNITKMVNDSAIVNSSLAGHISQFPQRVPIDNAHWLQTSSVSDDDIPQLSVSEMAMMYAQSGGAWYMSVGFLACAFLCGVCVTYVCFCRWAMQGKFDLPDEEGNMKETPLVFTNPFRKKPKPSRQDTEMKQQVPTISQDG